MWLLLTMSSNTRRWNATTLAPLFLDKNEKKTALLIPCFCNTKRAHFQGKSKKDYQILPQVSQYVVDCQVSWCPRRLRSNLGEKTKSLPDYGVLLTAWWSACHATNIVQDYRERNTNRHFFSESERVRTNMESTEKCPWTQFMNTAHFLRKHCSQQLFDLSVISKHVWWWEIMSSDNVIYWFLPLLGLYNAIFKSIFI